MAQGFSDVLEISKGRETDEEAWSVDSAELEEGYDRV